MDLMANKGEFLSLSADWGTPHEVIEAARIDFPVSGGVMDMGNVTLAFNGHNGSLRAASRPVVSIVDDPIPQQMRADGYTYSILTGEWIK